MERYPEVVLIHGFPLDGGMWDQQRAFLTERGITVHTPDLPGFGRRVSNPMHRCSISAFAEDIHHYILRNCSAPCVIAGFSMGGYVLFSLLTRFGTDACAVIFIDTHPAADSPEARQGRLASIAAIQDRGVCHLVGQMPKKLLAPGTPDAVVTQVEAIIGRQIPEGMIKAQMAAAMRVDQTGFLPDIHIPCLLIGGEHDQITPPAKLQSMAKKITGAKFVEIPGAAHLTPMEAPEAVSRAIFEFLEQLGPGPYDGTNAAPPGIC